MKILVIGDYISDVYTFGTATRLCPEAPVPVIVPEATRNSSGGGGLVADQLSALGANVTWVWGSFSEKHRYFAGNHLICRVDKDSFDKINLSQTDLLENIADVDAFVVSDYGKGAMNWELARQIVETGKPCFVDSKRNPMYYGPNTTIFPNEREAGGHQEPIPNKQFFNIVRKLGALGCKMGDLELPATVSEVVDVTGAGDIFMASFVYAWSLQLPAEDCLRFANEMAGESCRHRGTYVVPREFAQSVLDRLRASREPQRPFDDLRHGSNSLGLQQQRAQVQYAYPKSYGADGNLHSDLPQEIGGQTAYFDIRSGVQTPQKSPSGPTGSSDTQIPSDQGSLLEPSGKPPWEG